MLEIQVAEIDAGAEQRSEGAVQSAGVKSRGQQQAGFGEVEGLVIEGSCGNEYMSQARTRAGGTAYRYAA